MFDDYGRGFDFNQDGMLDDYEHLEMLNVLSDDDEQLDKEINQWSGGTQYHGVDQRTEPLAIIISVIILLLLIGLNIVIIECF